MAFERVVDSCEPNPGRAALKRDKRISENGDVAGGERFGYCWRTHGDIVIAEHRIALRALKIAEDAGAFPCDRDRPLVRQHFVGNKVTGEEDCIGAQAIDAFHGFTKEKGFSKSDQMNVAELGNVEAIERLGKIGKTDLGSRDFNDVARYLAGIKRKACGAGNSCGEEAAAGE